MLVSSNDGVQSYVTMLGLLLKMGFLVDVLAITFQYVVGCLRVSVRAGLHALASTVISSADVASAAALSIGSDLLQKNDHIYFVLIPASGFWLDGKPQELYSNCGGRCPPDPSH